MALEGQRSPLPAKKREQQQDYTQQQQNLAKIVAQGQTIAGIYSAGGGSKSAAPSPLGTGIGTPGTVPSPTGTGSLSSEAWALTNSQNGTTNAQVIQNAITQQAAQYYGGTNDPMVFTGLDPQTHHAVNVPLSQLANSWYTMDQATKNKFEAQLATAGYKVETMTDRDLGNLWGAYAGQAAAYNSNGKMVSLWDVLSLDAQNHQQAKPVTQTNTSTSYNISNYQDTHALFLQAAQSLLGRAPTAAETKAFQGQLNAYQRANPTVTKTTQTTDATGNSTSTSTSSGGTTAAGMSDLAQQAAQQNPDYGSYQAATTYFNSLLNAIGHM